MYECAGEDAVEEAVPPHRVMPQPDPDEGQNGGVDEREQHQHRRLPLRRRRAPRRRIVELRGGGGGRHDRGTEKDRIEPEGKGVLLPVFRLPRCWFWESAVS